jgi:hypothetical protein
LEIKTMTPPELKALQSRVGTTPDGVWGPKSIRACRDYMRSLMPSPNPWPKDNKRDIQAFFGPPGDSNLVSFEFPFPTYYDGELVRKGRCHAKIKDALLRVLNDIKTRHGNDWMIMDAASDFAGIYNFRPMRGGTNISRHSWGIAIDLDAGTNGLHTPWPTKATMPIEIMECFAREGFVGLGWYIGRDAMHFQAAQ